MLCTLTAPNAHERPPASPEPALMLCEDGEHVERRRRRRRIGRIAQAITQLKALADLAQIVSRALGLQGGLSNPAVREATAKFDAICEGLALVELRDALPPDRAEQIWRDALAALVNGMQTQTQTGAPAICG